MLGMIEINLLPPQYRTVERTPRPVFFSLLAAIVLIGGVFSLLVVQVGEAARLQERKDELELIRTARREEAQKVDQLNQRIREGRARVDTMLKVAEARLPWSLKLHELARLMPDFVWLDSLSLRRGDKGEGELQLACNARGTNMQRFTEFRQLLRSHTNFFHHFATVSAPRIDVRRTGEEFVEPKMLSFNVTLPLRPFEQPKPAGQPAPAPGRRR
ncbi:MAG: hypothetical protein KatS3mg102_2425 [Planctomycetota bacterium]|nr:MAG: hypothetical protein KatS3mg102_2425 [Planctomycetota bacterium]